MAAGGTDRSHDMTVVTYLMQALEGKTKASHSWLPCTLWPARRWINDLLMAVLPVLQHPRVLSGSIVHGCWGVLYVPGSRQASIRESASRFTSSCMTIGIRKYQLNGGMWRTHFKVPPGHLTTDAKSLLDHMISTGQLPTERDLLVFTVLVENSVVVMPMKRVTYRQFADFTAKMMAPVLWEDFMRSGRIILKETSEEEAKEEEQRRGGTPLWWAARAGNIEVAKLLLTSGASVDKKSFDSHDARGRTPLACAAEHGHIEMIELLLESGASVDWKKPNGSTPLLLAARQGRGEVVELLLRKSGARGDVYEYGPGSSPLCFAADLGLVEVVTVLLMSGMSVQSKDQQGNTPLHYAAAGKHAAVVQKLVSAGADVDATNDEGQTPEDVADCSNIRDLLKRDHSTRNIIDAQKDVQKDAAANPSHPSKKAETGVPADTQADEAAAEDCTDIHQAAEKGNIGAVKHFLRTDSRSLESKDREHGGTPLWWAARAGNIGVAKELLKCGASVDEKSFESRDARCRTPLACAAEHGHIEMIELLLQSGASMDWEKPNGAFV
eukprot:s1934_g9.t1